MKKTKCMGTSKNKRAMSGGRGKIGKYTQKFKRSYKRFDEIEDKGDDESRFKKMEEWGRMRNIYNFLKIQNDKYKGSAGTETTAWEKMNDNDDYKSAISCFEKYDNRILSEGECISEEDYMKGDTSGTPTVIAEASNNDTPDVDTGAADVSGKTEDNIENAAVDADANAEVTSANASDAYNIENAAVVQPEDAADVSSTSDTGETEAPADVSSAIDVPSNTVTPAPEVSEDAADVSSTSESSNTVTPAPEVSEDAADAADVSSAPAIDVPSDTEKKGGGRSKRRQKSSRRRGKSMKSKKGRKSRRKHRAGRH